jgi:hypothetical protein
MRFLGGHLGSSASALVDGQLDDATAERAWTHVLHCPECRRLVERETWVKRRVSGMPQTEPSARLLDSLFELAPSPQPPARPAMQPSLAALDAWAVVDEIERRGRTRRRVGIALVGAGSVSVAVFGIATLSGGLPGGAAGTPASSLTRPPAPVPASGEATPAQVAPVAVVHGTVPRWRLGDGAPDGTQTRVVDVSPR